MLRDRSARVGLCIILFVIGCAGLADWIAPHDPLEIVGGRLDAPSLRHPLGTDGLGRDEFSRLLHGARLSLGSAGVAAFLVTILGLSLGTLSGWIGGRFDAVVMVIVDVVLAFPNLLLALAVAALFQPSLPVVLLSLVSVWWVGYARIVRSLVLALRDRPFVEGARAAGAGSVRIVVRHIVPNVIPAVIVLVTLEMGSLILVISGLNFLGLGVQPPAPEWGAMLNDGRTYFFSEPRVMLGPGIAISLTVLGFNLLGDGLRDSLDPRMRS